MIVYSVEEPEASNSAVQLAHQTVALPLPDGGRSAYAAAASHFSFRFAFHFDAVCFRKA
jgi:hypothetical protein